MQTKFAMLRSCVEEEGEIECEEGGRREREREGEMGSQLNFELTQATAGWCEHSQQILAFSYNLIKTLLHCCPHAEQQ